MASEQDIFRRAELLLGAPAMERIAQKRVIIVGVGGVGSWCAEGLVRSGIRQLTIVDADRVAVSNINRQLMATTLTVGRPKVEALKERLLTINPQAGITARQEVFCKETAESFCLGSYDYIIDAIDSLKDKAALILRATETEATLYSSMGAAQKTDPSRIRTAEFWCVEGDPLARALRKKMKHQQQFPQKKFKCVFSDEQVHKGAEPQAIGSLVHITAIFGFTLAGMVIEDIVKNIQ